MATLNYDVPMVLVLFAQSGGTLTPTQNDLTQFDDGLLNAFDAKLTTIMTNEGLAVDKHSKSLVLGCRPHMPGNTPDLQISNGCRYVLAAQNALAPVVPATAASAKRALPKKKPRRKRAKIARARPRRS